MILITGATGHLGSATIKYLLKKTGAGNIAVFARDENKAKHFKEQGIEVRPGTFDDTASLDKAMQNIEKVLLISGTDANRLEQHKNVVDAAKKAGVKHIVYTSVAMKDVHTSAIQSFLESHFQTEDYIKESRLNYTFLRNTLYTDGIPLFTGPNVLETRIYLPSGDGKVPYALREEMGEAAANVLLQDGHNNKTYQVTGNNLHSYEDVANELSSLSGKKVSYTDVDASTFPGQLKQLGVPEIGIMIVSGFSADIKNKQFEIISNDLENLLGRTPATLKDSLKQIFNL